MSGTSNALVLLSTIRLRMAFRSPTAGGRPLATGAFFLIWIPVFLPRIGGPVDLPEAFFLGGPCAKRPAVVEKDAVPRLLWIDVRVLTRDEGVAASGEVCERHRQHLVEAMRWSTSSMSQVGLLWFRADRR